MTFQNKISITPVYNCTTLSTTYMYSKNKGKYSEEYKSSVSTYASYFTKTTQLTNSPSGVRTTEDNNEESSFWWNGDQNRSKWTTISVTSIEAFSPSPCAKSASESFGVCSRSWCQFDGRSFHIHGYIGEFDESKDLHWRFLESWLLAARTSRRKRRQTFSRTTLL